MASWRIPAIVVALAAALTLPAPAAAAATGSWTINLGCEQSSGEQVDILIINYSFDGLSANKSGAVVGRHTYGAGPFDWAQVSNSLTTDGAGHTANTFDVDASALTNQSYTPTPGDDFAWRVNIQGEGDVLTGTAILGGAPCGSTMTAATPTITGTAKVGHTLTASPGSWSPAGVAFSYQWHADGAAIAGQTGTTLALEAAQVDKRISVEVTGTKAGYTSVAKTSGLTAEVAKGTLAPAPKPKITGVKQVGKKLTAVPGIWGPGAVALSYQWYAAGQKIPGANGKKLKLKSAQVGKRITVKVTGTKAGYTKVTKASKPTVQILP